MRLRIKNKITTFVNTLTGEVKQVTLSHVANNRIDFQKWEQLDKDVKAVKQMRFKSNSQKNQLSLQRI